MKSPFRVHARASSSEKSSFYYKFGEAKNEEKIKNDVEEEPKVNVEENEQPSEENGEVKEQPTEEKSEVKEHCNQQSSIEKELIVYRPLVNEPQETNADAVEE